MQLLINTTTIRLLHGHSDFLQNPPSSPPPEPNHSMHKAPSQTHYIQLISPSFIPTKYIIISTTI